jgi:hypothetical protein
MPDPRSESRSEQWTILGVSGFMIICLIFGQIGLGLSSDLRASREKLQQAIEDTKRAMKDPNFYVLLITDAGIKSDSADLSKKLENAETAIRLVDEDARAIDERIRFYDSLIISFSALSMMIGLAMFYRMYRLYK